MHTDTTFFTNEPGNTLLDRFKRSLAHFRTFDCLVGYFRLSGFHELYPSLENVHKIRILVGIDADGSSYRLVQLARGREQYHFSYDDAAESAFEASKKELDSSEDSLRLETGIRKFIEFLVSDSPRKEEDLAAGNNGKKMEIRAYPHSPLHAKLYIGKFGDDALDYGRVITGSSNFSESGLSGNLEFNVELKESRDVRFAEERFDALWKDSVDLSDRFVADLEKKTWLNDAVSPWFLYMKMLYEYFKDDLSLDDDLVFDLPDGFMDLEFQRQAVASALKILNDYGGVFLADVVGLGKTFMAALLAKNLDGWKLVLCPPTLTAYWEETFRDFGIRRCRVESIGKLESLVEEGTEKFSFVFVDEAHRFRNEYTQGFEKLHQLCRNKKIILISATPLNNKYRDIFNLLKLFQSPKNSAIPGLPDLEGFFSALEKKLSPLDRRTPAYAQALSKGAEEIRDKVLRHVMVRRTRREITRYYADDMKKQGLVFPRLEAPHRIYYRLDGELGEIFDLTIERIRQFSYARYVPLRYLGESDGSVSEFELQQQLNIGGFMKTILVKRLESSFHAFRLTVGRFVRSYERFIALFEQGKVLLGKNVDVFQLVHEDEDELLRRIESGEVREFPASAFRPEFARDLESDLFLLRSIVSLWERVGQDPKLDALFEALDTGERLSEGKMILFTESHETGEYLFQRLEERSPGEVLFFSSHGGRVGGRSLRPEDARRAIRESFDPKEEGGPLRFLIATDVLSEGVNLHRASTVVNYDLPWNPVRVLQRVGRINRIGARETVRIVNFFPTDRSEDVLGLEAAVKSKLQAFHDTLGEDAKYLGEEEETGGFELFGDRLYRKLVSTETFEGETEERSELEYLSLLRTLRDQSPETFAQLGTIPRKVRSGRRSPRNGNALLTFFRQGGLKKFFLCDEKGDAARELPFLDAADLFACPKDEPRVSPRLEAYYGMLARNKEAFDAAASPDRYAVSPSRKSNANETWLLRYLKTLKSAPATGDDERFLELLRVRLSEGAIPARRTQRARSLLGRADDPRKALEILRREIPEEYLAETEREDAPRSAGTREIILSAWLEGDDAR